MGRTGVCWDNAAAESFFATLKNEMYHQQVFTTRGRARFAVAEYIEVLTTVVDHTPASDIAPQHEPGPTTTNPPPRTHPQRPETQEKHRETVRNP